MEFDYRETSPDVLQSVHRFENDELVSLEEYKEAIAGYQPVLSYTKGGFESLGMELDSETFERWKRVCSAVFMMDDFLDNAPDTSAAAELYLISMVNVFNDTPLYDILDQLPANTDKRLLASLILLHNSSQNLSTEQQTILTEAMRRIGEITITKTTCQDIDTYIKLLRKEGFYTGVLITASASESIYAQEKFNEFNGWFQNTLALGMSVDAMVDIKDDIAKGLTDVPRNAKTYARFGASAVKPLLNMVKGEALRATRGSIRERKKWSHK